MSGINENGPIRTTCPYCGVGCGVLVDKKHAGWTVRGDIDHPANYGKLCSKGGALGETLGMEGRLLAPRVEGVEVSWDQALDEVSARLKSVIDEHGPEAVAFYLSGQILTEDYYIANKLMKGFVGSSHVDTNSRLCMASTVVGHKRAFGSDTVPGTYEDLELADLVVLVGSNLAWCHPVLFQRLRLARERRGTRIIVIDPRRTDSCDLADLHLAIKPGGDVPLFNGLLVHLNQQQELNLDYIEKYTDGFEAALTCAEADAGNFGALADSLGVSKIDLASFYDLFANTEKVLTVFSQGVNQSHNGADKVNAIINTHLATGRIGRPGMGPFSVTGQPNAMGGREVGGLANTLAAHMDFTPEGIDKVGRFWSAPNMAQQQGLKAFDMFRAIDEGKIKFLWVMATNPAVSLPETEMVRRGLAKIPHLIVSDCIDGTDTGRFAQIHLPASGWGEKNGTVTNTDRTISRQRSFRNSAGQAKPDWWIMSEVGKRMGWEDSFSYAHPSEIFAEHAALSGFENGDTRDFDISAHSNISQGAYDDLSPFQWPLRADGTTAKRLFAEGGFYTPNRRAKFLSVGQIAHPEPVGETYSLVLNTGRYRDQWHTMTRTGLVPRLSNHRTEPLLELHPEDGEKHGVKTGDLAEITSRVGRYIARVRITEQQSRGEAFLPMHWNKMFANKSVIGDVVPGHLDPYSGQPASKSVAVTVKAYAPTWQGILITKTRQELPELSYWCRRKATGCEITEVAGHGTEQIDALLAHLDAQYDVDKLDYADPAQNTYRQAWLRDGRLEACLFVSPKRPRINTGWLEEVAAGPSLPDNNRSALLAGRAPAGRVDTGPVICACHQVGLTTIVETIRDQKLTSVQAIGEVLAAGTNCGSCIPELREILKGSSAHAAA